MMIHTDHSHPRTIPLYLRAIHQLIRFCLGSYSLVVLLSCRDNSLPQKLNSIHAAQKKGKKDRKKYLYIWRVAIVRKNRCLHAKMWAVEASRKVFCTFFEWNKPFQIVCWKSYGALNLIERMNCVTKNGFGKKERCFHSNIRIRIHSHRKSDRGTVRQINILLCDCLIWPKACYRCHIFYVFNKFATVKW